MTTSLGQAIGGLLGGAAFARTTEAWDSIPEAKRPAARGAWEVLKAVDMVSAPPLDEKFARKVALGDEGLTDAETRRLVFWRAGHAHPLLSAIWSFADAFCSGSVDEALGICGKMEDWFHSKGLRDKARHRPLSLAYGAACRNHEAGLELERLMRDSAAAAVARK